MPAFSKHRHYVRYSAFLYTELEVDKRNAGMDPFPLISLPPIFFLFIPFPPSTSLSLSLITTPFPGVSLAQLRDLTERCKLLQWVRTEPGSQIDFGAFLTDKSRLS